jgi:hypothetical protein
MGDTKKKLQRNTHENSGFTSFGLGFYWPFDNGFILGVRGESIADSFSNSASSDTSQSSKVTSISQSSTAFTIVKILGDEDFIGPFLRGEIAAIEHQIGTSVTVGKTTTTESDDSSGTGVKAEFGYGFLVGHDTRFVLTGGYMIGKTSLGTSNIVTFNTGFNF